MILLSKKWQDYLATCPESGMSYQMVNVTLKNGTTLQCAVGNQEYLYNKTYFTHDDIVNIEFDYTFESLTHL